jgi:hypothetical protein
MEMARDWPPSRTVRTAALLSAVVLGVLVAWGAGQLVTRSGVRPAGPPPTTRPATVLPATVLPATSMPDASAVPTTVVEPPPTTAPATTGAPTASIRLRPDGLGIAAFGGAERASLDRLARHLGAPDERGSWAGATPFGTCPGPVRAVRWGRLYVLFTNGPTRYAAAGRWHLFAYQVDATQRTKVDPGYTGPTPPEPPPLRGYSPRTSAGIGFGSTLAQVRAAYGGRAKVTFGEPGMVHRVRVSFGTAGDLWGSLSGGTPRSTVTGLAAGAICGE